MLFSDPDIAAQMNATFECAWESVAPVPHATIDFGNGHVLERTLAGNTATWLCTSDGHAVHALPGLFTAERYGELLRGGAAMVERVTREGPAAMASIHGMQIVSVLDLGQALSKGIVENPIKQSLGLRVEASSVFSASTAPAPITFDPSVFVSKSAVEAPVKASLGMGEHAAAASTVPATLQADSDAGDRVRIPQVHQMLLQLAPSTPQELTHQLFREILHVDLDDPYLGLAPDVLGGAVGRR